MNEEELEELADVIAMKVVQDARGLFDSEDPLAKLAETQHPDSDDDMILDARLALSQVATTYSTTYLEHIQPDPS